MSGDVEPRGRADPHRARRGRQHHQGDHQGHRDRDGRARRDRAVRLLRHLGRSRRWSRRTRRPTSSTCWTSASSTRPSWSACSSAPPWCSCSPAWRSTPSAAPPARWSSRCAASSARSPGSWRAPAVRSTARSSTSSPRTRCASWSRPGLLAVLAPIAVGFGLGVAPAGRLPGRRDRHRHPDGGLPGQLRWRLGQRQEAGRGRPPRRQGLAGPRGDDHRRHRRRPVQGHRRPGDQPADQGDEPGLAADRQRRRLDERRRRTRTTPLRIIIALVAVAIIVDRGLHLQAPPGRHRRATTTAASRSRSRAPPRRHRTPLDRATRRPSEARVGTEQSGGTVGSRSRR